MIYFLQFSSRTWWFSWMLCSWGREVLGSRMLNGLPILRRYSKYQAQKNLDMDPFLGSIDSWLHAWFHVWAWLIIGSRSRCVQAQV